MSVYLAGCVAGVVLTLNAWRPLRWPSLPALASGMLGWLTTELALHHLAWQALLAAWAIHLGALSSLPGVCVVIAAAASCAGLLVLHLRGERARASIEAALRGALGPDFESRLPSDIRSWVGPAFAWRRIALPFALGHRDVETTRGVPFAHVGGAQLRLDVHRHKARPTGRPILVYVHGGGWVLGMRVFQGLPLMRHLAARGWVCFSIDYRLSPRATFPDHLVDVKRALAWVREHAEEYGGDPDFVVLCGNSAGAHLAALAALTQNDPRYQPAFEHVSTAVRGCIGLYGVYDFADRHGHWPYAREFALMLRVAIMKVSRAKCPERYREASPIERVHEGAPPFLVVHGDRDSIAPPAESRRFAEALRAHGVTVAHASIPDAQHAFEVFSSPRTAHFVSGATAFLAHVYGRYLDERAQAVERETRVEERRRSGVVPRGQEREMDANVA
jgi:acetyl esterase/lipase